MRPIDHELLTTRTRAMAADPTMVVLFVEDFADRLRMFVVGVLSNYGRRDLLRQPDEVEGLVWDVAMALQARVGGWDPLHGVTPWVWARSALVAEINRSIGHRSADVADSDHLDHLVEQSRRDAPSPDESTFDLEAIARTHPLVALWMCAVFEVASPRDAAVHFEYRVQTMLDDPSPSHTVSALLGVKADHVRQIDCRVRARLAALAEVDERFGPLVEVDWLVPTVNAHGTTSRPTSSSHPTPRRHARCADRRPSLEAAGLR